MSNEIVKQENTFAIAPSDMDDDFAEEMQGLNITFERIKAPSGGGLAFEVPGENPDEPEMQKEFEAVVIHQHPMLSYYKEKYNGANEAPNCSSRDGVVGVNRDTGEIRQCKGCAYNEFGSGENGGKACKSKRKMFLLRAGEALPVLFTLPTTSVNDFSRYMVSLKGKRKRIWAVVTKFSLKKDSNKQGITFSKVVLNYVRDLTEEELKNCMELRSQVKEIAKNMQENYESEE